MEIVAAIDIGCSYCGYAFSSKREFNEDMFNIHLNEQWMSGHANLHTFKTPSIVLLSTDKAFHSLGYEAERKYAQLLEAKQQDQFFYFRRFKAALKSKQFRKDTVVEEEGGKSMNAITLLSLVLKYLRGHLLDTIAASDVQAKGYTVHYMVSVPSKWDHVASDCMKAAAKKAGVSPCTIVTESEAAARYCRNMPLRPTNQHPFYIPKPGCRQVIVNIGGAGLDTTLQEVEEDGSLKQIPKNLGNASAGHKVDVEFLKFMNNLFGSDMMDLFAKKHKMDYLELQYEFEVRKRQFSLELNEGTELALPMSLIRMYVTKHKQSIQFLIDDTEYVGKLISRDEYLILDKLVMKDIFGPAVKSVVGYLSNLSRDPEVKQVDAIILVGGFADSAVVSGAVKFYFPKANIMIPEEGELAVLLGSVLLGHHPGPSIRVRAQYTIGLGMAVPFKDRTHPKEKMFLSENRKYCSDVFQTHIRYGEEFECGEMFPSFSLFTNRDKQKFLAVPVYSCTQRSPVFTTDEGCELLGKFYVRIEGKNGRGLPTLSTRMTMIGSSVIVEATDNSDGSITQQSFRLTLTRPSSY